MQCLMDHITWDLDGVMVYLDDILVASPSLHHHQEQLRRLFIRLQAYGIKILLAKCALGVSEVDFLDHRMGPAGIAPSHRKSNPYGTSRIPMTAKKLQKFLGLINYHRFIPSAATILSSLHDPLKRKKNISPKQL
uniref:Reverse transcriptase domain-containing protein n=1 Tax=Scylla olivacea TaxID=85551 RepID=A0A0P4VWW0_SCYOL